jgi:hypothetical protein
MLNELPVTKLFVVCDWHKALSTPLSAREAKDFKEKQQANFKGPEHNLQIIPLVEYRSWNLTGI